MSPPRLPITACIITKDEASNIGGCLDSVGFCAEAVVVDSGSADRTVAIAREHGARVIERGWPGHIEQKNFAIDQAATDWVLCVDADERVSEPMRQAIEALFAEAGGDPERVRCAGVRFRRLNRYLGRWIYHGGWYPDRKLRLFRRSKGRWGGINPHDHVRVDGPVEDVAADLLHDSYRDLAAHVRTINSFTGILAREKLKRGERFPGLKLVLAPPLKFLKMYVLKLGVLDGWPGLIAALMGAWYVLLKYAKLWELMRVRDPDAERAKSSYADAAS